MKRIVFGLKLGISLLIAAMVAFNSMQNYVDSWQQKPHMITLGKESQGVEQDSFGGYHIPGQPYRALDIQGEVVVFEKYMPPRQSYIYTAEALAIASIVYGLLSALQMLPRALKKSTKTDKTNKRTAHL